MAFDRSNKAFDRAKMAPDRLRMAQDSLETGVRGAPGGPGESRQRSLGVPGTSGESRGVAGSPSRGVSGGVWSWMIGSYMDDNTVKRAGTFLFNP